MVQPYKDPLSHILLLSGLSVPFCVRPFKLRCSSVLTLLQRVNLLEIIFHFTLGDIPPGLSSLLVDQLSTHCSVNHCTHRLICAVDDFGTHFEPPALLLRCVSTGDSGMQMNCQCIDLMHQPWGVFRSVAVCKKPVHVCLSEQSN